MFCKKTPEAYNFIKKRPRHRGFPLKFAKFLRAPNLKSSCEWLLLILALLSNFIKLEKSCMNFNVTFTSFCLIFQEKTSHLFYEPILYKHIQKYSEVATFKTWTRTLDPGLGPWKPWKTWKPGPWKIWTLKNMGNSWIWKNDWKTTYYNLLTLKIC